MAQVLADSVIGYPQSLALFSKTVQNIGLRDTRFVDFYPVNDYGTQNMIQFIVNPNGSDYVDLSKTLLKIRCKVVKASGTPVVKAPNAEDGSWVLPWQQFNGADNGNQSGGDSDGSAAAASTSTDGVSSAPGSPAKAASSTPASASSTPASAAAGDATVINGNNGSGNGGKNNGGNGDGNNGNGATNNGDKAAWGIVGVINNFLNSLFSRVDLSLQNRQLTDSDSCYPYLSYFKTLLHAPTLLKNGALQMQMYFDTPQYKTQDANWILTSDKGFQTRSGFFNGSQEVELCGRLACDAFSTTRLLPNGISMQLTLYPSAPEFCLMSPDVSPDPDYKIVITRAALQVCQISVAPEIIAAHSEILKTEPALYPLVKSEIKKFQLGQGIFSAEFNNIFENRMPSEMTVGIVSAEACHGSYTKDPLRFEHCYLNHIQVVAGGQDIGNSPMSMKYGNTPETSHYLDAYRSLSGVNGNPGEIPFDRKSYYHGRVLYRFVVEQEDSSIGGDVMPLKRSGCTRISLKFDRQLDEAKTLIIFAQFPSGFRMKKNRAIHDL